MMTVYSVFLFNNVVQVARLLLAVDRGQLHEFRGKHLSDINVDGKLSLKFLFVIVLYTMTFV